MKIIILLVEKFGDYKQTYFFFLKNVFVTIIFPRN